MKKGIKNIISVAIAATTALSVFGCGGTGNNGVDTTKSQLYVCYFDAGFSNRWLTAAAERFEEMYKDYSFEDGKVGVQIIPDPSASSAMENVIQTKRSEVYFIEGYTTEKYNGSTEDITNALNVSLGASYGTDKTGKALPAYAGETQSIFEKMRDYEKDYYVTLNDDGSLAKATVIPYTDCATGTLTYDADVFEKYALYYKADNTIGATKASGVELGLGPDGVKGTADDGLPRTYDEFFEVCRFMKTRYNTIPFVWAGNYTGYLSDMATSLFAQNVGATQMNEILHGEGTVRDFIDGDVSTTYTTKEQAFDANTFSNIYNSEGLYGAVDFSYQIIKNLYYAEENCFNSSYSHEVAQGDFIFGSKNGDNDYGFLIDGAWWYNEAEKYIKSYETREQVDRSERNLLYMAMPKVNEAAWERTKGENVVYSLTNMGIVVKKGISDDKKLLAETFLRFYCTDESLAEYDRIVSVPRALNYTLTDEQYDALSPYGKSLYSVHNGMGQYSTFKVVYGYNGSEFYHRNQADFKSLFTSKISGVTHSIPAVAFNSHISKGLNAKTYFNGILTMKGFKK